MKRCANCCASRWARGRPSTTNRYLSGDVAHRAVAELLTPRRNTGLPELAQIGALLHARHARTDDAFESVLQSILCNKLWHAIADFHAESDPAYSRIHRAVTDHLHGSSYRQHGTACGVVYNREVCEDPMLQAPPVPAGDALHFIAVEASRHRTVAGLMEAAFDFAELSAGCRRGWSKLELCSLLLQYHSLQSVGISEMEPDASGAVQPFELEELIGRTIERFQHEWRKLRRGRRDPLLDDEYRYAAALCAFLADFTRAEPRPWYEYFHEQYPGVGKKAYQAGSRKRFERMMNAGLSWFLEQARQYFFVAAPQESVERGDS